MEDETPSVEAPAAPVEPRLNGDVSDKHADLSECTDSVVKEEIVTNGETDNVNGTKEHDESGVGDGSFAGTEGSPAGAEGSPAGAEGSPAGAEGSPAGAEGSPAGAECNPAGVEGSSAGDRVEASPAGEAVECNSAGEGVESSPAGEGVESSPGAEGVEGNEDARSVDELDSLRVEELALAAGSDSGVEGCGRALSSGGGSRSCASSVVSCGSGCGSESSSLAAPPRPRRKLTVTVPEPRRPPPVAAPRPATAPRGPNLATRERARSREKPTPPEKPRPLTPKPRLKPASAGELPPLVRESPALRAKPTKTSAARCRTPGSPGDERRWPTSGPRLAPVADTTAARLAADKYGTLPRRRRDADADGSPKHEAAPARRPTVARSASSRGAAARARVRIYAEKTSQTVLVGGDVEAALGGLVPDVRTRVDAGVCHRGVQAGGRAAEAARAAALADERARRERAEHQLAAERAARHAALADLERNSQRLLELAGAAGAGTNAEGCLRALEEQLRAAGELAARNRAEIDELRDRCNKLHTEACRERGRAHAAESRRAEAEREAAEMQDFLAAETHALQHSLSDADADVARLTADLDKSRSECRQLVRMCEQRRQEALALAAGARAGAAAHRALDALAARLRALHRLLARAYRLPPDADPTVYYNDAYSRSDSGEALTPEEEFAPGLAGAVARALRAADDDRSQDDADSADLLDSETEPCLVTDPEYAEEWWSGAEGAEGGEGAGGWSGDELSPERDAPDARDREGSSPSERSSLRTLSAAIAVRQRSEEGRGALAARVQRLDERLGALLAALRRAHSLAEPEGQQLVCKLRDRLEVTEKNVADVVVKKLAELDASKHMMEQYRQNVEILKMQLAQTDEEELAVLEEELSGVSESDRLSWYASVDVAVSALGPAAKAPRLAALRRQLERVALALLRDRAPPQVTVSP